MLYAINKHMYILFYTRGNNISTLQRIVKPEKAHSSSLQPVQSARSRFIVPNISIYFLKVQKYITVNKTLITLSRIEVPNVPDASYPHT